MARRKNFSASPSPLVPIFVHGTGSLLPFDSSYLAVALLCLGLRALPTLCWIYLALTLFTPTQQRLLGYVASWLPDTILSTFSNLHRYLFLPWVAIEVIFSLYHSYLARQVQGPGPKPLYSRKFLHRVFARALKSGLGMGVTDRSAVALNELADAQRVEQELNVLPAAQNGLRNRHNAKPLNGLPHKSHSNGKMPLGDDRGQEEEGEDPEPWFLSNTLSATDPRAVKFRADQAMWFHLDKTLPDADKTITRRGSSQWLAWALFNCTLEELEDEHQRRHNGDLDAAEEGPTPVTYITAADRLHGDGDDDADPGLRRILAQANDWDDPSVGTRLDFVRKARRLIEARQGSRYPLVKGGEPGPDQEIDGEGLEADDAEDAVTESMRLTLDPVGIEPRPFFAYCVTQSLSQLTLWYAIRHGGFTLQQQGRLSYLVKIPPGWTSLKASDPSSRGLYRPTIFLHGLGIGLAQYSSLVDHLAKSELAKTHPVMIPLQPHISQNIFSKHFLKPIGHHEMVLCVRKAMRHLGWEEIQILSHSMGTIVHAWLLKSLGTKVKRSCFVDPVCFRLFIPQVCGNFVYFPPNTSIKLLMRYFVGRELGTANTLCRYFDWASAILWPQDEIPNLEDPFHTQFYLAGQDSIIDCKETRDYLMEYGVKEGVHGGLIVDWKAAHGELLMKDGQAIVEITRWLEQLDPQTK
ncbi:unnamed protein product [Sympodiomycopsis kandeliae]